jgi:general secretion pathway protein I
LSRTPDPERDGGAIAGFTIIEVLIALAVVGISLAAIGSVVAATTRGTGVLEERVALMETVRALAANLPPATGQPIVPGTGETQSYRWSVNLQPWSGGVSGDPKSPWFPQLVTMRVRSPSGALIALQTVRLQKKPSE